MLLLGAIALLSCLANGQTSGTYATPGAQPQSWSISEGHALIWDGKPYMPTGLRVEGSPDRIGEAQKAGCNDFVVELPANGMGWKAAFAQLEQGKSRYFISINSLAPMARGFAVEPDAYRITGITAPRPVNSNLPGCTSVLAVLAAQRDNDIEKMERVQLKNEEFNYLVKPGNDIEHVLYIYPETSSLETPDCWEGLDAHRDSLLAAFRQSPPGPGFRGLINPVGQMLPLHPNVLRFVPHSPYFLVEFRAYLEAKYHNVESLQHTWGMSASGIENFETLARLVPLWSENNVGVPKLWDPSNDRTYLVDSKHSHIWGDLKDVVSAAVDRRFNRLVAAIRSVANVPIIQDWVGWSSLTEGSTPVDGVGMQVSGASPSQIEASASRATSSILRWPKSGLLVATRIRATKESLTTAYDDAVSLGARGCFFDATDPALEKAALALNPIDASQASISPSALFFPENAMNPAEVQGLPFGKWWLPSPANGNRLDLGTHFFGYRMDDGPRTGTVLWTNLPLGRYRLHVAQTTENIQFQTLDGTDPQPRKGKGWIEVTMGSMPLLITGTDQIPIPENALNETNVRYAAMLGVIETNNTTATEERYAFGEPLKAFDVNPGGAFAAMRDVYTRLAKRMSLFTWIEAELTRDNNFSGAAFMPECSGSGALVLRTRLDDPAQRYVATFKVQARTGAEQEVWIAAKFPADAKTGLEVEIGGQIMTIQSGPVSFYGSGFAWYKMGTTRLKPGQVRIDVAAMPGVNAEVAVDAVVLYPGAFSPKGVAIPDPIDFDAVTTKKGKGKGGGSK